MKQDNSVQDSQKVKLVNALLAMSTAGELQQMSFVSLPAGQGFGWVCATVALKNNGDYSVVLKDNGRFSVMAQGPTDMRLKDIACNIEHALNTRYSY